MKPITKHQKYVDQLSNEIKFFTKTQKKWVFDNCLEHTGVRLKSGKITCLDCGHHWQSKTDKAWHDVVTDHKCPNCKTKLKVKTTQKKKFDDWITCRFYQTYKGYQIIRYMRLQAIYVSGEPVRLYYSEVSQIWIGTDGKLEIFRRIFNGYSGYFSGNLELRNNSNYHSYDIPTEYTYPEMDFLPELLRNGFYGNFYGFRPAQLFTALLGDGPAETLLKTNQMDLFEKAVSSMYQKHFTKHWPSIKIALRHKYEIKDWISYFDHLDLLKYFKKDLRNPHYICPKDFKKVHSEYSGRKHRIKRRQEQVRLHNESVKQRQLDEEKRKSYVDRISRFSDLEFKDGDMKIVPFTTIEQFDIEGSELEHCIYANAYYNKTDSLLLSVRVKEKIVETVEVSLSDFKILQLYGMNSKVTPYYNKSFKLVMDNMPKIREVIKKSKRKNKTTENNAVFA